MQNNENTISRRTFWLAGGATLAGLAVAPSAEGEENPAEGEAPGLKSRFLFEMVAELEPPQDVGERQIYVVKSGTIRGPRINGVILPGGGDWSTRRADGTTMLDVRGTIKTDDDQLVYTWYRGIVAPRPSGLYFRTTPYFETASEKYGWLNTVVAVGVFKPVAGKVAYDVYEIL